MEVKIKGVLPSILALAAALALAAGLISNRPALAEEFKVTGLKLAQEKEKLLVIVSLSRKAEPTVVPFDEKGPNPRIIVDFAGAKADRLPVRIDSPSPIAKSVRTGVHADKVRVVVDLMPGQSYLVEQIYAEQEMNYVLRLSAAP